MFTVGQTRKHFDPTVTRFRPKGPAADKEEIENLILWWFFEKFWKFLKIFLEYFWRSLWKYLRISGFLETVSTVDFKQGITSFDCLCFGKLYSNSMRNDVIHYDEN